MKKKRKARFSKAAMKSIRKLSKEFSVDMHEAARMYVRRGF